MFAPCSRRTLVRACSTPGRSNVRTTSASGATGSIGASLTGLPSRNEGYLCSGAWPDSRAEYRPSLRGGWSFPSGRLLRLPPAVCAHLGPRAAHVHRAPTARTVLGAVVESPQAPLVAADLEPPPGPLRKGAHRRDEQTRRHPADRFLGLPPALGAHLAPRAAHALRPQTPQTFLGAVVKTPQAPLFAADLDPPPGPPQKGPPRRDEQTRRHPADRGAGSRRQQT